MDYLTEHDRREIQTLTANKRHEKAIGRGIMLTDAIEYLILCGHPNKIVYRVIHNEYCDANTTMSSIATMRSRIRRRRPDVPSSTAAHRAYHRQQRAQQINGSAGGDDEAA